ncbi:MAG: biotin transporter BioY [Sporomusaceae bacterium]|nr:biotin transporter BioY [Sporomusaceae bacterium]
MKLPVRDMILIALFAAFTAVGAFTKIPTPIVPYTLQFLFCAYAGLLLGSRNGAYSQLLYVALGLIGIPVFVNGGGPAYVLQPTFGYLVGFILCAFIIGKSTEGFTGRPSFLRLFSGILLGLACLYLIGVTYLYGIVNLYLHKEMAVLKAIAVGFTPYILPDLLLSIIIAYSGTKIIPILNSLGLRR